MKNKQDINQNDEFFDKIKEYSAFIAPEFNSDEKKRVSDFDKLVKAEKKKLLKILSKVDDNLLKTCDFLIENITNMSILSSELFKVVKAKGIKEVYYNGRNQAGIRERLEFSAYKDIMRIIPTFEKILIDLLKKDNSTSDDEIEKLTKWLARPRNSLGNDFI